MKLDATASAREQFERYLDSRTRQGRAGDLECRYLEQVYRSLDFRAYDRLQAELLERGALGSEAKYLDLFYWIRSKLRLALEHGLHRMAPLRLLDLGTGAGHFPYLCRLFGHDVTALDLGHIELYNRLVAYFEVRRIDFEIRPLAPLPRFEQRFALVTGFMVGFNKRAKGALWGEPEWLYFLGDLARNVTTEDGRLLLKLIRNSAAAGLHYTDPAFARMIQRHGGVLDLENGIMTFAGLQPFRDRPPTLAGSRQPCP